MHICNSSRHNEMSKPVFWLHNLKSRYIDFVATYVWLRANNALFMGFPSASGQCNWFFMLHWLISRVLRDPVIRLRCWLIRRKKPIILQFSFFQLKTVKNKLKLLVMMEKLQIFIGVLISILQECDFFYVSNKFKSLDQ